MALGPLSGFAERPADRSPGGKPTLELPRCPAQRSVSVQRAFERAIIGARVHVRGRVAAQVPCLDSPDEGADAMVSCVGPMKLDDLMLQGTLGGVELTCTRVGRIETCPVRIGLLVIATGRFQQDESTSSLRFVVDSLCRVP